MSYNDGCAGCWNGHLWWEHLENRHNLVADGVFRERSTYSIASHSFGFAFDRFHGIHSLGLDLLYQSTRTGTFEGL